MRARQLRVVVATGTLAMGINMSDGCRAELGADCQCGQSAGPNPHAF